MNGFIIVVNESINYQKLLQGRYEAERLPKDFSPERIVPDFAFNVLNPLGLLYRPVVDEDYLANGGQKPVWPDGKPFAASLSHDVDSVSNYSVKQSLRTMHTGLLYPLNPIEKVKSIAVTAVKLARSCIPIQQKDPLHYYEKWLSIENEVGARSTFFFWPGWRNISKHHPSDCTYDLFDHVIFDDQSRTVAEMIQEIDHLGWEIGLHPSWYSYNDIDEMKRQKDAVEKILGHDVVSVRQHFIDYDIQVTPAVQAKAGFKYDSTLGFNDNVGFRFGTSYPFKLYDLKDEKHLEILEMPLIIQDGALLNEAKGMRLDEDTAFEYVVQLTENVERVGGVLTLIWHPNSVIHPSWWSLYLRTLGLLNNKNAWCASISEIGNWWKKHCAYVYDITD